MSRVHVNDWDCSNSGRLNTQIDKFDYNNGNVLDEIHVGKNIVETAELLGHIRLKSSKSWAEKDLRY